MCWEQWRDGEVWQGSGKLHEKKYLEARGDCANWNLKKDKISNQKNRMLKNAFLENVFGSEESYTEQKYKHSPFVFALTLHELN